MTAGSSTFTLREPRLQRALLPEQCRVALGMAARQLFYVVWQQNRDARDPIGTRVGIGDAFRSVRAPGTNIFSLEDFGYPWVRGKG